MNYSKLLKGFRKEFGQFSQYKKLGQPLKALAVIGMLPFLISSFALIGIIYVYVFMYNCIAASVEYLEAWLKNFKQDVSKGIAEAVVYLIALPFIYVYRCILSLFAFIYYILWFELMCITYISSLAGIKWQPVITSATYEDDNVIVAKTSKETAKVIITIIFALFCFLATLKIVSFIITKVIMSSSFNNISAYYDALRAISTISGVVNVVDTIYTLFVIIAVPIGFKHAIIKDNAPITNESQADKEETQAKSDIEEFPEF